MQTIYLDIANKGVVQTIYSKQKEVGRKFKAILTDAGNKYHIDDGYAFSVWYSGDSGEGNYTAIGNRSAFYIDDNSVVVELITQMLANEGTGVLCLVMSGVDGSQIATWNINYIVENLPGVDSEAAQQYYTAFSENVSRSESAARVAESAANNATGVLENSVRMVGDINSKDDLPDDYACLFRTVDSNWGGDLPLTYAAYARLRSGRSGNYTTWLGGNGSDLYYTMTGDANMPTAGSWKKIAFADEKLPYLVESENLNTSLDEILSTMADQTAKQIQIYDQSFSEMAYLCTLWRFTGDYAVIDAVSYGGYRAIKRKCAGVWQPWEWENPPLVPGIEYRTTQRWVVNGTDSPVYIVALNGTVSNGTIEIQFDDVENSSQFLSAEGMCYPSDQDTAKPFNVDSTATLYFEFNRLYITYTGSRASYNIIVRYTK